MPPGIDFKTFAIPAPLSVSVLFTAIFPAAAIVRYQDFGFFREMLAARSDNATLT